MVGTGAAVIVFGSLVFMWVHKERAKSLATNDNSQSKSVTNDASLTLPPDKTPEEIAQSFTSTSDIKLRLSLSRNPQKTATHLKLYPKQALDQIPAQVTRAPSVNASGTLIACFIAQFRDGTTRTVNVVPCDGQWKVDWDAYARYCTSSWDDIQSGIVSQARMRAVLRREHLYPPPFRDEKLWQCYAISSPDMDDTSHYIYGYARKDSAVGCLLTECFKTEENSRQPLTFTITSHGSSHARGHYEITHVHTLGWVDTGRDISKTFLGIKTGIPAGNDPEH